MAGNRVRTKKDSFTSGVLILSLSAITVKIIGLVYKIPMLRLLGSEGMGYFNSAYEIYALFCAVATTGLPVAMSVMISARREKSARDIFKASLVLFCVLGAAGCGSMIAFAKPFATFLGSEKAAFCIAAISPTVFLICLSGAYRGFFQGKNKMVPTAVSQIIEALGKLVLGLIFAFIALKAGFSIEVVAAFAVMGLTLGTAVSLLYLAVTKRLTDGVLRENASEIKEKGIIRSLLRIAIPVTLSSSVVSITRVLDMSLILRRLQDMGESSEESFSLYGIYTTLALPLFALAPALISSVALPLIPALSGAIARGDEREQTVVFGDAMKLTALVSMPISLGLTLFSKPILRLLFSGETEAIAVAAPLLSILGLSVPLSCMITVGNATLQAYGRPNLPIFSMLFGTVAKLTLAYFLIGNNNVGLLGAPISTFLCDFIINAINFYFICRAMPNMPGFAGSLVRPTLAAAVSVTLSRLAYQFLIFKLGESAIATVLSILLAVGLYIITVFLFGVLDRDDLSKLPIVGRFCSVKEN